MGRYRAPTKPGTKVITPQGAKKLKDELDYLWRKKRPEVTQAVSEAAALGDRSENAEYIYGKKQLREIDSRIRFLRKRLDDMTIVERLPEDTSKVFFGAYIKLENEEGEVFDYRIVGPDEFDLKSGLISIDSPLSRALLTKSVGDEVLVNLPSGDVIYEILQIHYSKSDESL